jgi:hypothetical protein
MTSDDITDYEDIVCAVVICIVCRFVKVLILSQIVISKATTSTLELQLLGTECINNHKLLHFSLRFIPFAPSYNNVFNFKIQHKT